MDSNRTEWIDIGGRPGVRVYDASGGSFSISKHLDELLTRYQPTGGFVGGFLMPLVNVEQQRGVVPIFGVGDQRLEETARVPGEAPREVGFNVASMSAIARPYALSLPIPVEYQAQDDGAWRLRESGALHVRGLMELSAEARFVAKAVNSGSWGENSTTRSSWATGGNPFGDVQAAVAGVSSRGGLPADTLALGDSAAVWFFGSSATNARCGGWATPERAAAALGLRQIRIASARYNTGVGAARQYVPVVPHDECYILRAGDGEYEPRWAATASWRPGGSTAWKGRFMPEVLEDRRTHSTLLTLNCWEAGVVLDPLLGARIAGCGSSQ